jgi:hypothetical protein
MKSFGASAARPNPARTLAARPVRIGPVRSTRPCFGCLIPRTHWLANVQAQYTAVSPKKRRLSEREDKNLSPSESRSSVDVTKFESFLEMPPRMSSVKRRANSRAP